jgi:dimethylamine/trimethylamine dehydrogenase
MANVEVYLDSVLTAAQVLEFGFEHVILATGATWRRDGVGVNNTAPIQGSDGPSVYTPEDVFAGADIAGPILVFDNDNFYMGGVIAEKLRGDGLEVTLATTESVVSSWTSHTLEQARIQTRILELGISVVALHNLAKVGSGEAELSCIYTERRQTVPAASVVMVSSRQPNDALRLALIGDQEKQAAAGILSVQAIGDCDVPSTIAAAVYDGHRAARELDADIDPDLPFRREHIRLEEAN